MLYHLGKTNFVANVLSKKTQIRTIRLSIWILAEEFTNYPWLVGKSVICSAIVGQNLMKQIWEAQRAHHKYEQYVQNVIYGYSPLILAMWDIKAACGCVMMSSSSL